MKLLTLVALGFFAASAAQAQTPTKAALVPAHPDQTVAHQHCLGQPHCERAVRLSLQFAQKLNVCARGAHDPHARAKCLRDRDPRIPESALIMCINARRDMNVPSLRSCDDQVMSRIADALESLARR